MPRTILLLLTCALLACDETPRDLGVCPGAAAGLAGRAPAVPAGATVSHEHLRGWVELLAAPEMKGRHATGPEASAVAALLAERMAALGLAAPFPNHGYCQPFPLLGHDALNVVGHLPAAAGPGDDAVLVGAHYDGQGLHPAGYVFPSADDNASGVAALLETARLAARREWPFALVFVAFGAEELGQLGARAWLQEPTLSVSRLRLMINFDMVGRPWPVAPAEAIGYRARGREAEPIAGRLAAAATAADVRVRSLHLSDDEMISDSTVFKLHVPALDLSTGLHADHHQRTDTAERVDVRQTARAVELTLSLLETLARP